MIESATADRLLLASRIDCCLQLAEPTFITAEQTYWVEHETGELCVDRGAGRVTRHPGRRRSVSDQGTRPAS